MTTPSRNLSEMELTDTDGKKITLWVGAPDLTQLSFTVDRFVVRRGIWAWYSKTNFNGPRNIANPTSGAQFGFELATSSSIKSAEPLMGEIILYEHSNFSGGSLVLTESAPDLRVYGCNDTISSIRVISGKWRLYHNVGYSNPIFTTTGNPESISSLPSGNDAISSVEFLP